MLVKMQLFGKTKDGGFVLYTSDGTKTHTLLKLDKVDVPEEYNRDWDILNSYKVSGLNFSGEHTEYGTLTQYGVRKEGSSEIEVGHMFKTDYTGEMFRIERFTNKDHPRDFVVCPDEQTALSKAVAALYHNEIKPYAKEHQALIESLLGSYDSKKDPKITKGEISDESILLAMETLKECYDKNLPYKEAKKIMEDKGVCFSMEDMEAYVGSSEKESVKLGHGLINGDMASGATVVANAMSESWGYLYVKEWNYDAPSGEPTLGNWIKSAKEEMESSKELA